MNRRHQLPTTLARAGCAVICVLCACAVDAAAVAEATAPFSFLLWSDTHFDGVDHVGQRADAVADMIRLDGAPMVAGYGTIDDVAFVLHAGDITTNARENMWANDNDGVEDDYLAAIEPLPWPSREIRGNHDADGGRTCIAEALAERQGALWYSFDHGGIHFVGLDIVDKPPQPGSEQLAWLQQDLAAIGPDRPVFLWWHIPPTGDPSWNALADTLAGHNVLLICHGHTHSHRRNRWRGFDTWDAGHVDGRENSWSGAPSTISVFRVEDDRLRACHYLTAPDRWDTTWMLSKPLRP